MTMSILLFVVSVVYLLSLALSFIYDGKVAKVFSEILKYSTVALATICVCISIMVSTPQAIDVYRNKTTLEITYKDSIPIDSVVVFKDK